MDVDLATHAAECLCSLVGSKYSVRPGSGYPDAASDPTEQCRYWDQRQTAVSWAAEPASCGLARWRTHDPVSYAPET